MHNFVLIHGAWHNAKLLQPVANYIEKQGYKVNLPTLLGNKISDKKNFTLDDVIEDTKNYLIQNDISDAVLVAHSYSGFIITKLAQIIPKRIKRLVYCNAFVPLNNESLFDLIPKDTKLLLSSLKKKDNSIMLPFNIWRNFFMNDSNLEVAKKFYEQLNPHPFETLNQKITLKFHPAKMNVDKSYINATEDTALPHSYGWHPRLSERLGIFRLIQTKGSHQLCLTNPKKLAKKIILAGSD